MNQAQSRRRRFFSYYKPYKALFAADLLSAMAFAAIALILPQGVGHITKDILEAGLPDAVPRILVVGCAMTVLAVLQHICNYIFDAKGHAMGARMERDMRAELFAQYQRLPFSFHDDNRPGKLMSRVTNDLLLLTELYHHGPEDLVVYLIKFIGAFVILFRINPSLTGVIFAILPVMAAVTLVFNRKLTKAYKVNYERIGEVNARVEENLSGIRTVQSFANEGLEIRRFQAENNSFLAGREAIYRTESYLYVSVSFLTQMITVAVAVFGGMAIAGGTLDLADLILFLLYVGYLVEPIPKLAHITKQYQEGFTGFSRFMDIMELEPEIADRPGAEALGQVRGHIELRDVSFAYQSSGEPVLSHVSLAVEAGETVALIGSSGVGKTTLCSLIPRFYDATEGQVLLDGRDVRDISLASLRESIGVVQQEVYLFAGTVLDNILYGRPRASRLEAQEAARRAGAYDFIAALPHGFDTDIGHRGIRLSVGQKQRIGIARVFLKNPPILILDEATSALDTESERLVQQSLTELAKDRTTFIIAHRLSTIRDAGKIVVLSGKGIDETGTHSELLRTGGIYARYYKKQTEYGPESEAVKEVSP